MSRYRAFESGDRWLVVDRWTNETLPREAATPTHAESLALAEVLNCLEDQQHWRAEARLWPEPA